MRGYFGIGVEGLSKSYNLGNLFRSAHAFDASFVYTVGAVYNVRRGGATDTSKSTQQLPFFEFPDTASMMLPQGCRLVGVELVDDAVELPSFRHPMNAAYILGPERSSLSADVVARCDHIIKIPTKFCLNVGIAGVVVMYDRLMSLGRFAARPTMPGGPIEAVPEHVHGGPVFRSRRRMAEDPDLARFRACEPTEEVREAETAGATREER